MTTDQTTTNADDTWRSTSPYTEADVNYLADVIAEARLRGIRNGALSLARVVLDAGYRRRAQ